MPFCQPSLSCAAAAVLLLGTPVSSSSSQGDFPADDDRLVLFAVFEQSIRPWVSLEREIAGLPAGPVSVTPHSLAACSRAAGDAVSTWGTGSAGPPCASVEPLRTPDAQGFVAGSWDYREETRQALAESFNARNAMEAPLPLDDLVGVRAAAAAEASSDFVVQVSRPGYTSNGFAIVYGQAMREGTPKQGWAFVLSRFSGRWAVQHAYLLWILQ